MQQEAMVPIPIEIDREALLSFMDGDASARDRILRGSFHFDHFDKNGFKVNEWEQKNIVTDEGLNYLLDVALSGGTQISAWYLLLKDNTGDPLDGSETYATPVFSEITDYTEGSRPAWTDGGVSSQSVDNSGSVASFSINATVTVYGAGMVGGGSNPSTKGNVAGGGKLFCVSNFSSSKALSNGDTLQVTYTVTAADDGV